MLYSCQSGVRKKLTKFNPALCLLLTTALLGSFPCRAQVNLPGDTQGEKWVPGPASANLGKVAQLKVPVGYSFSDAAGAREVLRKAGNPVPKGLLGIMRSVTGGWTVVFESEDLGYLKEPPLGINGEQLLSAFKDQFHRQHPEQSAAHATLAWKLEPQFN